MEFLVYTKPSTKFNFYKKHGHSSIAKCIFRLRCRQSEEFINKSELVGLDHLISPTAKMINNYFDRMEEVLEEYRGLDKYANEFMESSKFVVSADIPMDVKKLEGATNRFYEMMAENQDYRLCSSIVERLVQILEYSDIQCIQIQYLAVSILSSARHHGRCNIINKQAIPVLVKLINHPSAQFAKRVIITLTRLALACSDHIPVIVDNGALEAAQKFVLNSDSGVFYVVHYLAMLLVVVCSANNITPDKEKVAISITRSIFKNKFYSSDTIPIKRACNAFSHLSYRRHLPVTKEGCDSLVKFLSDDDELVVDSALKIAGNFVRWGNVAQIQLQLQHDEVIDLMNLLNRLSESVKLLGVPILHLVIALALGKNYGILYLDPCETL